MPTFHDAKTGAAITVKVTPRAKKTEVAGVMEDGTIRVRVAAAPEEGAANRALIAFLAAELGIAESQIDIVAGHSGERKLVSLIGVTPAEVGGVIERLATAKKKARAEKEKPGGDQKKPGRKKAG